MSDYPVMPAAGTTWAARLFDFDDGDGEGLVQTIELAGLDPETGAPRRVQVTMTPFGPGLMTSPMNSGLFLFDEVAVEPLGIEYLPGMAIGGSFLFPQVGLGEIVAVMVFGLPDDVTNGPRVFLHSTNPLILDETALWAPGGDLVIPSPGALLGVTSLDAPISGFSSRRSMFGAGSGWFEIGAPYVPAGSQVWATLVGGGGGDALSWETEGELTVRVIVKL